MLYSLYEIVNTINSQIFLDNNISRSTFFYFFYYYFIASDLIEPLNLENPDSVRRLPWPLYLVNADPQHVVGPNLLGSRQHLARILGPADRLTLGAEIVLAEMVLAGNAVIVLLGGWVEHGGIVQVVLKK